MSFHRRAAIAGQGSLGFGSRGDAEFAELSMEPVATVVTPAMADNFVKGADANGLLSPRHLANVAAYALSMGRLEWKLNGDPIVVDLTGRLVDGRARCQACVRSGVPFPAILFKGVGQDAEYSLDMKTVRSKADTLYISGSPHPTVVAKACEAIHSFVEGSLRETFHVGRKADVPLDNDAVRRLVERYPQIEASAKFTAEARPRWFSHAMATAAHFLMTLSDRDGADRFFTYVVDPSMAPRSIPARLARKSRRDLTDGKETKALAILGKCWKAFVSDTGFSPGLLTFEGRVEGDDSGREAFPDFDVPPSWHLDLNGRDPDVSSLPVNVRDLDAVTAYLRDMVERSGLTARVRRLDADMAARFLATNGPFGGRNRKIHPTQVEYLKAEIRGNRWEINGQSVKIGRSGSMIDGQHRCKAVVETGIPVDVLIVEGLDDDVFSTFDGGQRSSYAKRTQSKAAYANERAAALKIVGMIRENDERSSVTSTHLRRLEDEFPLIEDAVIFVRDMRDELLSPSVAAATYAVLTQVNDELATGFFRSLGDGVNLDDADPVYALREKLLKFGRNKSPSTYAKHVRWIIHAWNAAIEGRPLTSIRNTKGPGFPKISHG